MTSLTCRAVLVDMDGTLVDSTALVDRIWTTFAAQHELDAEAVLAFAHGRPTIATLREFLPAHPDHAALVAELEDVELGTGGGTVEVPGAVDLVRSLPEGSWALVTSAGRDLARLRLGEVGIALPAVTVTSEDVRVGKPDPEPYLLAARRLGVDPGDCVVLEDAPAGIASGLAAGAAVVVVGRHGGPGAAHLPQVADHRGVRATALPDGRLELTL